MCSFVKNIAIDVNWAELLEIIPPTPGLSFDKVFDDIVEADPTKTFVLIRITFFLHKLLYFSYKNHCQK